MKNTGIVWVETGQDGGTRRRTDRLRTIGSVENGTRLSQPVEIGQLDTGLASGRKHIMPKAIGE
jgi:hypothetical protein